MTQNPQHIMMKVQQTLFRYGVVPVASLAGAAPGPVPRTDPPSSTGREEQPAKHKETSKTRANGNPTGPQCQTPVSGGKEGNTKKGKPETLNILQFNASGIGTKKFELAHILNKHNIHVALIQETDIGKDDSTFISNYTATNCSCRNCQGTTTYIRNDVTGYTENLNLNPTCIQLSTIWHSNEKFSIYNVYNPPPQEIRLPTPVIDSCILKKTILAGDFNGHSHHGGTVISIKLERQWKISVIQLISVLSRMQLHRQPSSTESTKLFIDLTSRWCLPTS